MVATLPPFSDHGYGSSHSSGRWYGYQRYASKFDLPLGLEESRVLIEEPLDSSSDGTPQATVLIDFPPRAGLKEVSLSPQDLAARSAAALDSAMASIRQMSERIAATTRNLAQRPDQVEVEFGLKLDAAGGALLARAGAEAHLVVTLRWTNVGG
jgi:Trypsin-co-occurring domain 1